MNFARFMVIALATFAALPGFAQAKLAKPSLVETTPVPTRLSPRPSVLNVGAFRLQQPEDALGWTAAERVLQSRRSQLRREQIRVLEGMLAR